MNAPDAQIAALAQLALEALGRWPGNFTDLVPIKFRENAVFSVRREDGRRFALRIHRHGYHHHEALRAELTWMRALAQSGIGAPPVLANRDGAYLSEVEHPAVSGARQVDLLEWLPGTPIGTAEEGVAQSGAQILDCFHTIGATAAAIHNQSAQWSEAEKLPRHRWDSDGLVGADPLWGRFWEMPGLDNLQRRLLLAAREKAAVQLQALGTAPDRFGLIHADFVPENLLFDGARLNLIDFDDCGFGWHLFELATALFFTLHQPNHGELRAAILAGYRQKRTLPSSHEALLPLFLFLRGTTYLGWMQTRSETQTAREMAPAMIRQVAVLAQDYLADQPMEKLHDE